MWITNHPTIPHTTLQQCRCCLSVSDKAEQVVTEAGQGFGGGGQQGHEQALSCPQTSEVIPGISGAEAVCTWLWGCVFLNTGLRC